MPVKLLYDAEEFRAGAEFDMADWASTHYSGYWPDGSRWRFERGSRAFEIVVQGHRAVRQDTGQVLHCTGSGYRWETVKEYALHEGKRLKGLAA